MTRRDVFHYLGVVALCPLGGYVVFVLYVLLQTGRPDFVLSALIWIVGYPIAAVAAGVLGLPFLIAQSRRRFSAWGLLPAFIIVGVLGGAIVYALLFGKGLSQWNPPLTFEYVLMGVGVSLVAWLLAAFGPLKLSGVKTRVDAKGAT
jgi:hypothetical protein